MIHCLEEGGLRPAVPIGGRPEFEGILESEEAIMGRAVVCKAAVMICNKRKYSKKFMDEVETLVYDTKNPVIVLVQNRCFLPLVLRRRRRVTFVKGRHLDSCGEHSQTDPGNRHTAGRFVY
jgi:hypothetical protein